MGFREEFIEFIKEYQILSLAIAFVVGIAVKDLVSATVDDLIMPLIGIFLPSGSWENYTVLFLTAELKVGHFLSVFLDFLLIAVLIFVFVKYIWGKEEVQKF